MFICKIQTHAKSKVSLSVQNLQFHCIVKMLQPKCKQLITEALCMSHKLNTFHLGLKARSPEV